MTSWDERFLEMAALVGSWSKDPSTKVGAVIVRRDRTIASLGYNGFPRGVLDTPALYEDRPTKLLRTVHAEMNAILSAREPLKDCIIYVSPLCPCANCAAAIIQAGITDVVARTPKVQRPEWKVSFDAAMQMFKEANVGVGVYFTE